MPGRKPLPAAIKKERGNPGKRKLNEKEPSFTGFPVCPTFLTPVARTEWDRVTQELTALNMLRSVDTAALASYCLSYARWISAEETVTREGQTISEPILSKSGEVVGQKIKRHPATTIAKDEKAAMHRAAALFGFDPSSRTRLSTGEPQTQDPFEAFMATLHKDTQPNQDAA
ncbi:phage terminase, small subunit, putative, P27 family [Terriglobus roseus]|uniref:Phage terminase, small subunit, putative, P27 family n=2 Tax=Terriglobus roseus TaxID=392734 RepID=A0A1H4J3E2_9BACT|nr:phage terminase small subunit P27 family [Terriglobus roseus]SEB40763.1 phage terminase, small subunit, putative, P27 family [Terriglobus roseus]